MINNKAISQIHQEFKELICLKYKKFYVHALISVKDFTCAEDIVQETLLTAFEKLNTFQQKSSLETWIFGILNKKILQYFKEHNKDKNYIEIEDLLFNKNGSWKKEWMQNTLVDYNQSEENVLITFLKACINFLKGKNKQVLIYKFFLDIPTEEICQICQLTKDNVWQMLHRSKLQLKVCIQNKLNRHHD